MIRECSCGLDIRHIFIDLDNTLYINDEVDIAIIDKIHHYMMKYLAMSETKATHIRHELYAKYNSSLLGLLVEGYDIDIPFYQKLVHDLEYEKLVFPDPELKTLLMKITQPKYLFTNGTEAHATQCLKRLQMEDVFQGIISFDSMQKLASSLEISRDRYLVFKPDPQAYKLALDEVGAQAEHTLFVDDSSRNILAAMELNMPTLQITQGVEVNVSKKVAPSLIHLPKIYPCLFDTLIRECPHCTISP
eukprot:g5638.t1